MSVDDSPLLCGKIKPCLLVVLYLMFVAFSTGVLSQGHALTPTASMSKQRFFVVAYDGGLYERYWNGAYWEWIDQGQPPESTLFAAPGAVMQNLKLFVPGKEGRLFECLLKKGKCLWVGHGRPGNEKVVHSPCAAMMNQKFFVVTDAGNIWERHWRAEKNQWVWNNHGRPGNEKIIHSPGAAMMDRKFFVVTDAGNVWERHWRAERGRWVWNNHGRPGNEKVIDSPGAAMMDQKFFVVTDAGNVWERHWRSEKDQWVWNNHGRPGNEKIVHSPGAAMMHQKFFVVTDAGNVWERHWHTEKNQWVWNNHASPAGTRIVTSPGTSMRDQKLFVGGENDAIYERYWNEKEWIWVNHGKLGTVRIMPLGDSITAATYEKRLANLLAESGYEFDLVGSQRLTLGVNYDSDHEGHSGKKAGWIANRVNGYLSANPANIVLLHIGTNDIGWKNLEATAIDLVVVDVERILDEIDRFSKRVTVFIARIIHCKSKESFTKSYNDKIEAMVLERKKSKQDKLFIVDMQFGAGINYDVTDMNDECHPNKVGYNKIAKVWHRHLSKFLSCCASQ